MEFERERSASRRSVPTELACGMARRSSPQSTTSALVVASAASECRATPTLAARRAGASLMQFPTKATRAPAAPSSPSRRTLSVGLSEPSIRVNGESAPDQQLSRPARPGPGEHCQLAVEGSKLGHLSRSLKTKLYSMGLDLWSDMKLTTRQFLGFGLVLCFISAAFLWRPVEPSYEGRPLTFWLHFLNGPTRRQQLEAEAALRGMGVQAVPALLQRIVAKDPWWKRTLVSLAPKDTRFKQSFHPEKQQSMEAAVALGLLGSDAASAQPRLLRALLDNDPGVRACAARALGAMKSLANTKIPELVACLNDRDERVRDEVSYALGSIGSAAMPAVLTALRQENPVVQLGALKAMGAIFDRNAQRRLSSIPTSRPPGTPMFALDEVFQSTNGVGVTDVLTVLALRLKSVEPAIRGQTASLLWLFGSEANPVLPMLIEARNDWDKQVRAKVQNALDMIGYIDPKAPPNPSLTFKFQDPRQSEHDCSQSLNRSALVMKSNRVPNRHRPPLNSLYRQFQRIELGLGERLGRRDATGWCSVD